MDPARSNVLMKLDKFPGMYTNAPRGLAPAPILLQNVWLSHTGGYAPMEASTRVFEQLILSDPAWTGNMSDMVGDRGDWTRVMPNLFLSPDGSEWSLAGTVGSPVYPRPVGDAAALTLEAVPYGVVEGLTPEEAKAQQELLWGPPLTRQSATLDLQVIFSGGGWFEERITQVATPEDGYYLQVNLPAAWPADEPAAIYLREATGNLVYLGVFEPVTIDSGLVMMVSARASTTSFTAPMEITPAQAEFHKGRVYLTGAARYPSHDDRGHLSGAADGSTKRVYYSQVLAAATSEAKPLFSPDRYFDVPFKISESVTAMVGVGAYLYIFGERELWLMTGDPEYNSNLDQIGDSIGTLAPGSVQQLSGAVYWLSDSGALMARGGQVTDVGEPIRDLLAGMKLNNLSSTTDFQRELWWLSDGAALLCYHTREGGWTQRGADQGIRLMSAGGAPYGLLKGELRQLRGGPPLPMTVKWPYTELGEWRLRKVFQGLAVGLDLLSESATVENLTRVDNLSATTTVTAQPTGAGQVKLHTTQHGTNMQGLAVQVGLRVTTQDTRGILRPPLTVFGTAGTEETWTDEQRS